MNAKDLGVEQLSGQQATQTLDRVANNGAVRDLAARLGVDASEIVGDHGKVERLPQNVDGVEAELYVAVPWISDASQTVRTGHFVATDGTITSRLYRLDTTGSESVLEHGSLSSPERVSASEAQNRPVDPSVDAAASQSFSDCVGKSLGINASFVAIVVSGCGLACAITAGTACIVCAAGAFGYNVGSVAGVFIGCSTG